MHYSGINNDKQIHILKKKKSWMQVLRVQIFTIYNHRVYPPPPARNWLFIHLKQGPEDYFDPWLQNNVKYKTKNKDNEDKSNGKERRWEGGGEGGKKS